MNSIARRRRIRERTANISKIRPSTTLPPINNRNATSTFIRDLQTIKPLPPSPTSSSTLPSLTNKIPKSILNKYKIPKGTLTEINKDIKIVKLTKTNRATIFKDLSKLNEKDITQGVIVCRKGIGEDFIRGTTFNMKMKGFIIKNKNKVIGFMFYLVGTKLKNKDKFKVELVCANKGKGKLKGMPLGRIMFDILELQARKNPSKIRQIKLESVPNPNTIKFYKDIGFKKTTDKVSQLDLIPMTKTLK